MKTIQDSLRLFDATEKLIDDRSINRKVYEALAERIHLQGLALTVTTHDDLIRYPPQDVRKIELTDGYCHVVGEVKLQIFLAGQERYVDSLAYKLVMRFAQERYLKKR